MVLEQSRFSSCSFTIYFGKPRDKSKTKFNVCYTLGDVSIPTSWVQDTWTTVMLWFSLSLGWICGECSIALIWTSECQRDFGPRAGLLSRSPRCGDGRSKGKHGVLPTWPCLTLFVIRSSNTSMSLPLIAPKEPVGWGILYTLQFFYLGSLLWFIWGGLCSVRISISIMESTADVEDFMPLLFQRWNRGTQPMIWSTNLGVGLHMSSISHDIGLTQ